MQAPSSLRPLEPGELIDRTIAFWRGHLKPLFALGIGFHLALYTQLKTLSLVIKRYVPALARGQAFTLQDLSASAGVYVAMAALFGVYAWTYWSSTVAASAFVVPALLDRPSTPGGAVRRMFSRSWALTGSLIVAMLLMGIGIALMIIPFAIAIALAQFVGGFGFAGLILLAIAIGFVCLAIFLFIYLRLVLTGPVIGFEDRGPLASLLRSSRLVSGRVAPGMMGRVVVRAGVMFTVVFALLFVIGIISGIPSLVLGAIYGGLTTGMSTVPQALLVPAELFQVVVQALFSPIAWVFASVFYLDLRVRKEGLDLELQLAPVPA